MRTKKALAALLSFALLAGLLPAQGLAANVTTDFYARAEITKDATVSFNGKESLVVAFQVQGSGIKGTQSLSLAYDSTLFELLDGNGTSLQNTLDKNLTLRPGYVTGENGFTPWQTAFAVSGDGATTYALLQPEFETETTGLEASDFMAVLTLRLGLRSGNGFGVVTQDSVRLLTKSEADGLNQSSIAIVNNGSDDYKYGNLNGADTLDEPDVFFNGVIPLKPDYAGTEAVAPVVASKKGDAVSLLPQDIPGETVEYAHSADSAAAPQAGWQTGTAFVNVPAGSRYFWARVAESDVHMPGTAAFTAVTVFAAPSLHYDKMGPMALDTPIDELLPTLGEGAGAKHDSFAVTVGTLPGGLALDAATGAIRGTPTAAVVAGSFTVTYTDQEGQTVSAEVEHDATGKKRGTLTIAPVADVVYGNTPVHDAPVDNDSGATVTYTYSREKDGSYGAWNTSNGVGTYWAKGSTPETASHQAADSAPVSFSVASAPITGSVSIQGDAVYGKSLTANPIVVPGTLSYQWYRDDAPISGASGSTYSIAADDVGHVLTVKVSDSAGNYSGAVEISTAAVEKAAAVTGVTGQTVVVSSAHDQNPTTSYTYPLSGLSGLPNDLLGLGYQDAQVGTDVGGMLSAPVLSGGALSFSVTPKGVGTTGTLLVTVTSDNYMDITATITVTAVDKLSAVVGLGDETVPYDGLSHALAPTWPAGDAGTEKKTLTYAKNGVNPTETAPKDAGTYTVTATYEDATSYGTATATLTIQHRVATLVWSGDSALVYDGNAKRVTAAVGNLISGDACTVTVSGADAADAGTHTATATGLSNQNYRLPDVATHGYTIAPLAVTLTVELSDGSFPYNGSEQKPTVTVKNGTTGLTEGTDYTIVWPSDMTNAGEIAVAVIGAGNYAGSTGTGRYEITALAVTLTVELSAGGFPYNGGEQRPTVTVKAGTTTLKEGTDYTVVWPVDVTSAGEKTVTVAGMGNYAGSTGTEQYHITALAVTLTAEPSQNSFTYSGNAQKPTVTVKYGTTPLTEGADYTVVWPSDLTNVGEKTMTVTGAGNYAGSTGDGKYHITALEAVLTWVGDTNLVYNAAAKNVTAAVGNLVSGDTCAVTVTGGAAINAGTYTATATGLSNANYALPGVATRSYTIAPKTVSLTVELSDNRFLYDGSAQKPTVTVKDGTTTLSEGADYTITWPGDVTNVGEKTVTAVGAGNYAGSTGARAYYIVDASAARPDAPVVSASAGNGSVTVSWRAPEPHGAAITGYKVWQGNDAPVLLGANTLSHHFTGLSNGTSYTFRVVAVNVIGESDAGTVTAVPVAPAPPSGGGGAQKETDKIEISTDGKGQVDVKIPVSTDQNGAVSSIISNADGKKLLDKVKDTGDTAVVLSPKTDTGANKVTVSIPSVVVGGVAEAGGSITVENAVVSVVLGGETLGGLAQRAKQNVSVTTEKRGDAIAITVSADQKTQTLLAGGMVAVLPGRWGETGDVAVLVHEDGSETIIKKSAVVDGQVITQLPGSAVVRVISNAKNFRDMTGHWAQENVDFVSARELFQGTGDGQFSPNEPMSRGMLVTVLYRLEDMKAGGTSSSFTDVDDGQWYAEAVRWGSEEGIVSGVGGGRFAPDDAISREMLAVMLYRYCGAGAADQSDAMDVFQDRDQVSDWAEAAMGWAVTTGVISGRGDGMLAPGATATRAEVSTMMRRFVEYLLK